MLFGGEPARSARGTYHWQPRTWWRAPTLSYVLVGNPDMTEGEAIHLMIQGLQMRAAELKIPESPFKALRSFMRDADQ